MQAKSSINESQRIAPLGEFGKWIDEQFGMSQDTASNFMRVAERFGDDIPKISEFGCSSSILYELASPSFPEEEARELLNGDGTIPTEEGDKPVNEASVAEIDFQCSAQSS